MVQPQRELWRDQGVRHFTSKAFHEWALQGLLSMIGGGGQEELRGQMYDWLRDPSHPGHPP